MRKFINVENDQIVIRIPKDALDELLANDGPLSDMDGNRELTITNVDGLAQEVVDKMNDNDEYLSGVDQLFADAIGDMVDAGSGNIESIDAGPDDSLSGEDPVDDDDADDDDDTWEDGGNEHPYGHDIY